VIRATITFPLGVYHAQSPVSFREAEWPPSPVRLIGALLAAAHGRVGHDPESDRALLQRLCEEPPPLVIAPRSVAFDEADTDETSVVRLRGASRWAPRNHSPSELTALSTRDIGRGRAAIEKVGTAIGARPVHVVWPEASFIAAHVDRLNALASDVTFLGTARSPVLVEITDEALASEGDTAVWTPGDDGGVIRSGEAEVRVPDAGLIRAFDQREAMRRARKDKVERAGLIPAGRFGRTVSYRTNGDDHAEPFDPRHWGDMIVLAVDREASELIPNAPAAYLLARAVRASLLGAYTAAGTVGEAPEILRARGSDPHCAIVPLPFVGHRHADGHVLGVGFVLPHASRVPDLEAQRLRVEQGLLHFSGLVGDRRHVDIPGAGRVFLKLPAPSELGPATLREQTYRRAARTWVSVTPVVHSRWRTSNGPAGLGRQVAADCADVGLPVPVEVEQLTVSPLPGAAFRALSEDDVPAEWRGPMKGPTGHVRMTFAEPVVGPVLLGRARHFGLGLCLPDEPQA
jgi:CRISPR-associated protein Csb2